ncbi:MAG: lytic transglycosylase domain-containing protein [Saprospiraceae bacterium]|nr:lytic transglycosylase domain-containing protein [Saprospiraceae bacterium]
MKKKLLLLFSLVLTSSLVFFISYSKGEVQLGESEQAIEETTIPQMVKSADLSKIFTFAGERIPTEDFDVLQRLDNELTLNIYRHGVTLLNIKKAARFFPVIEQIFKERGIPDDLKYIAVAESDLQNATSPAGAKGFWQIMPAVAEEYGLEVNDEVDERFHLEKSTVAAAKLLQNYKNYFGSWSLAVAAYNGGIGRIKNALQEQRGVSFYDLNVNQETSRYLFRVIAIKEIISNPRKFGYYLNEDDLYPVWNDYYMLQVDSNIENLADFARKNGISYRQLKAYNPWLIATRLTNPKRKVYEIKIPYLDK